MIVAINSENPPSRLLLKAVKCLMQGGIVIYPTDTMYAIGCDINNKKAVERICRIKNIDPKKAHLTCICDSLKIIGQYAIHVSTPIYKLLKTAFPGPYTIILQASKKIPKHFQTKRTVGIRVTEHNIPRKLVQLLGNPIASISIDRHPEIPEFHLDPQLIYEQYSSQVDMVIDGGMGSEDVSTVIDCSDGEQNIRILRQGIGSLEPLGIEAVEA